MSTIRKFYKRENFKKGDFIIYEYIDEEYLKGQIIELKPKTAIIEIALPCKKNTKLQVEEFEVGYDEIIPFSEVFIEFENKEKK